MLKVSIDSGRDYLEYLRPYVIQVLMDDPPESVTDETVAEKIRKICGLEIPYRTVHIILQRLAREGYLDKASGIYAIVKQFPASDMTAVRADAARHIAAVTTELVRFAKESANRDLSDSDAAECFIVFLSQFSIPCLKSYLRGTALPVVKGGEDWKTVLVSQFVSNLPSKPELFDSFMKLVQGHMLANALLCPDLQSANKTYKDVTFYFDTPLLIQILGLEGEREKQAIEEVVRLVQQLEGTVSYFSHTFDELVNAIRSSADYVDSPKGRGTIVEEARKSGQKKSDLLLVADDAAETLDAYKIFSVPTPPYEKKTHKFEISEEVFESVLEDEIIYFNPRAKEYDIKSVRSIYVLRKGLVPFAIEKSKAVFVTSNTSFSKAAYEYGKKHEQSREVSTVITDFSLANTAWLKAPQGAPSLPRKEVLAFAYAAMRPTTDFWNKVLVEAEKLEASGRISVRHHQLLRSSHHVQVELMKLTLGEDDALTHESITAAVNRVTSDIRKEDAIRIQEAEEQRLKVERQLAEAIGRAELVKQRIYWRCNAKAERESRLLSGAIWASQGLVAFFGVVKLPESSTFGLAVVGVAVVSGLLRMAGARWDIKPLKAGPAFLEWRRARLLQVEYAALSIQE